MNTLLRFFTSIFEERPQSINSLYREWDKLRAEALTPSHKAEIDAIFSRHI